MKKLLIVILVCLALYGYINRDEYIPIAMQYVPDTVELSMVQFSDATQKIAGGALSVVDAIREYVYTYADESSISLLQRNTEAQETNQETFSILYENRDAIFSDPNTTTGTKIQAGLLMILSLIFANMLTLGISIVVLAFLVYKLVKYIWFPTRKRKLLFERR